MVFFGYFIRNRGLVFFFNFFSRVRVKFFEGVGDWMVSIVEIVTCRFRFSLGLFVYWEVVVFIWLGVVYGFF